MYWYMYSMNMIITTWTFIKDVNVVNCSAIEQKMNLFLWCDLKASHLI